MPQFPKRPTKRAQELRNNATDAERRLWTHLSHSRLGGFKFSRQMPVGPFICDFLCRERALVVELDGGHHSTLVARDSNRTRYLEQQGLTILRFWNNEVLENMDGVLAVILERLETLPPRFTRGRRPPGRGQEPSNGHAHPQPPPASGRGLI